MSGSLRDTFASALDRVERWASEHGHRLVREPPLDDAAIDALPALLEQSTMQLAVPYRKGAFAVPPSYRELLRLHRAVRLEIDDAGRPAIFRPFELWAPSQKTLTKSWTDYGTTVDDRPITTTELIAFANAGFSVEASRWCFYTRNPSPAGEYAIVVEDNDYECLTGHYVDDGSPLSGLLDAPPFRDFASFFMTLSALLPQHFNIDEPDALVNAMLTHGGT